MKSSAAAVLLFVMSLLGGGLALQAKDAFTPAPKFAFSARPAASGADAGSEGESQVETLEAQSLPQLRRLAPHSLQVIGR
jgi:hypothetical protein